ncbi:MAG: TonB family protein [Proteobacteria bacterium]|nr:TonB family protein [Pseudomonadota bacterium]
MIAKRFGLASVFALALVPAHAADTDAKICGSDTATPAAQIAACTALIAAETSDLARGHDYELRSTAYFETGAFVRALSDMQQSVALLGESEYAHFDIALSLMELHYFKRAEPEVDTAIDQGLTGTSAYLLRGVVRNQLGRFDDARKDLDVVISASTTNSAAYAERGFSNLESGRLQQAVADYDKAIALDPGVADSYYFRGRVHYALDEFDAALKDFREAGRLSPKNSVDDLVAEIEALQQPAPTPEQDPLNHPARAVGHTHSCAAYYPRLSNDLIETGDSLVRYDVLADGTIANTGIEHSSGSDRLDRAALLCVSLHWRSTPEVQNGVAVPSLHHRAIIQFETTYAGKEDAQARRAATLAGIGRYAEAVAQYDTLILAHPDNAEYFFRRGFAKYLDGNYSDAAADFDAAIRAQPGYDDAVAAREIVRRAVLSPSQRPTKGI